MRDAAVPEIARASGSLAWTPDGRCLVDLVTGFGTAFLGHGHPLVVARLREQAGRLWTTARHPTPAVAEAHERVRALLPAGMRLAGFYSTGMEAAEFAMRVAAVHTGRQGFVGFARSMHGKSAATAALAWDNAPLGAGRAHVLPFVDTMAEDAILDRLAATLAGGTIAAVFVEPIQGSNGAREASPSFHGQVASLCREAGTLLVFDEVLTGLHRTGTVFRAERLGVRPDALLFAKSMGNGFPVSAVAVRDDIAAGPATLPGSTFSDNPLAASVVAATLAAMRELPMAELVAGIDATVRAALGGREADGITLRGCGALWALELGTDYRMDAALAAILESGVLVSAHGRHLRLLPAANIDLALLRDACGRVAAACASARA